jgi:DNA-binding NarL/FixJ family response regulator
MMGMRIILADDQPDVRSALKLLLEEKPGNKVTSEVSTSGELVRQIRKNPADLILLDWELPDGRPQELLKTLQALSPQLSVIALSSRPQMRKAAMEAGAKDFVCKSEPPELLMSVLEKCYHQTRSRNCAKIQKDY